MPPLGRLMGAEWPALRVLDAMFGVSFSERFMGGIECAPMRVSGRLGGVLSRNGICREMGLLSLSNWFIIKVLRSAKRAYPDQEGIETMSASGILHQNHPLKAGLRLADRGREWRVTAR